MTRRNLRQSIPYKIWMKPDVHAVRKQLPGHIRQQIKRVIDDLAYDPRPSISIVLRLPETIQIDWEVRRIKLENWRIVYAVSQTWQEIGV